MDWNSERPLWFVAPKANQRLLRNVPEGRGDRSLAGSAWDCATAEEPSRRVRCESCRSARLRSEEGGFSAGRPVVQKDRLEAYPTLRQCVVTGGFAYTLDNSFNSVARRAEANVR